MKSSEKSPTDQECKNPKNNAFRLEVEARHAVAEKCRRKKRKQGIIQNLSTNGFNNKNTFLNN